MEGVAPVSSVCQDGTTLNIYHADINQGIPRHAHNYSHLTICCAGSIVVRKEGIERFMDKHSQPVNLKAGEWHEIEAIEDGTVFINVFAME